MKLYALIFKDDALIRVPEVVPELSTKRLLTMTWLDGGRLLDYRDRTLEERNRIARAMFRAWWYPFSHYGVIHGDPHLGNYTVFEDGEGIRRRHQPARLWLHAELRAEIHPGRGRPLSRAVAQRPRARRACL